MIIEASLMLATPLCNDTIVSLVANQANVDAKHSEDEAADNKVLQGTLLNKLHTYLVSNDVLFPPFHSLLAQGQFKTY